jgi:hypothetical protein
MNNFNVNRGFLANGKIFTNIWKAYDELYGTEHGVTPVIENDAFKNLKGTKINTDTDYLAETLKIIFQKFKNINLLYSGGADSHTIAVKSKKLNLKFESILLCGRSILKREWEKHWYNSAVKKFWKEDNFIYVPGSIELFDKIFNEKEQWWYRDPELCIGLDTKLSYVNGFDDKKLYLSGHDKPYLFYNKGEWYAYVPDDALLCNLHQQNVFFTFGLNSICPEFYVSQSRKIRDWYMKNFEVSKKEKFFLNYKSHNGKFIKEWNKVTGLEKSLGKNHDANQNLGPLGINQRHIPLFEEFRILDRWDLFLNFINSCNNLYKKHSQIQWDFPPFSRTNRIAWLLNIDSLECLPGDQLQHMQLNQ